MSENGLNFPPRQTPESTYKKIYMTTFVCMATMAIHFQFVSDLTSEVIIITLKRFFTPCGESLIIFSNNAINFVGASAELKCLHALVLKNKAMARLLV